MKLGRRVAICDQVEDPALAKGVVKREVTETVTPGTVLADNLLNERRNNYLVALVEGAGIPILGDGLQAAEAVAKLCWYYDKVSQVGDADSRLARILTTDSIHVPCFTRRFRIAGASGRVDAKSGAFSHTYGPGRPRPNENALAMRTT